MARDPATLRKAYEVKLGKDRVDKLTNEQIGLLSKHYNSLSDKEQSDIDSQILKGYRTELHEIADAFIEENKPSSDAVSIYTAGEKFVDDKKEFAKEQEEKLEKALEEQSDKIMDAIDELIAADRKKFEDFKKQQQQQSKGKSQYEKPVGPNPMQGPKEPPKKTFSPEKDEDWEGEVPDQLDSKLDDLLEQVRNEPLPQPTKTKRRKSKGKKVLQRKSARVDAKELGVGGSLTEIMANVMDTREALFDLYKVTKARFEFKKKIDKKLTGSLTAKLRERQIEKGDKSDDSKGLKNVDGDDKKKKKPNAFQKSLISGLVGGAVALTLPLIIEGLRPFMERDRENEGDNQWWDFLDVFPNEVEEDLEEATPVIEAPGVESPTVEEPTAGTETPTPVATSPGVSAGTAAPAAPPQETAPAVTPMPVRDTNIPGDSGYRRPQPMPLRKAATGGKFTEGKHKPLTPISRPPVNNSAVKKLTRPLASVVSLPQKAAAAGVLSFASSLITPFAAFLPDAGKNFIQDIYKNVATSSGLSGMKLNLSSEENLIKKLKKKIGDIFNSLLGITPANAGGGGGYGGGGGGGDRRGSGTPSTVEGSTGEQNLAAFLSTMEASGNQNQADAFQVMLNRAANAQAGGSFKAYGTTLGDQITGREQFSPLSSAIYGVSADSAAAAKYGPISQSLGATPEERKKRLLEIASEKDGLNQLQKLFGGGSASDAATVLEDFKSGGDLSKQAASDIGSMVSFRGYRSGAGDFHRGQGGNYFFGSGSHTGSLTDVSPDLEPVVPKSSPHSVPEGHMGPIIEKPGSPKPEPPDASPRRSMIQQMLPFMFPQKPATPKVQPPKSSQPAGMRAPQQPGS